MTTYFSANLIVTGALHMSGVVAAYSRSFATDPRLDRKIVILITDLDAYIIHNSPYAIQEANQGDTTMAS